MFMLDEVEPAVVKAGVVSEEECFVARQFGLPRAELFFLFGKYGPGGGKK